MALPLNCCALTLVKFVTPVLGPDSLAIFELSSIVPYLKARGRFRDPISLTPLYPDQLIPLHFAHSGDGSDDLQCPISFRRFTGGSRIVAIKSTGNVYSMEALKQVNAGSKDDDWVDPLTNEVVGKSQVITIQDPTSGIANSSVRKLTTNKMKSLSDETTVSGPSIRMNSLSKKIMEIAKVAKRRPHPESNAPVHLSTNTGKKSKFSTGLCAASLTSTGFSPVTSNDFANASESEINEIRWKKVRALKKKGYVRIATNFGNLNLELFAHFAPRTCENFIGLALSGKYDGCIFHRKIKGFMLQGGDPTGTGNGGASIWGKSFKDEIPRGSKHESLSHSYRGVLSMANSGPDSNKSQFFVTFGPCTHLDGKHTIFGRLVGGFEVLEKIEEVPTDSHDRPYQEIKMINVLVFTNPFDELKDEDEQKAKTKIKEQPTGLEKPIKLELKKRKLKETQHLASAKDVVFSNFEAW